MPQGPFQVSQGIAAERELDRPARLSEIEKPEILIERPPHLQAHSEIRPRPVMEGVDPETHRGPDLPVRLLSPDQRSTVAGLRQDQLSGQEIRIGIGRERQPRDPFPNPPVIDRLVRRPPCGHLDRHRLPFRSTAGRFEVGEDTLPVHLGRVPGDEARRQLLGGLAGLAEAQQGETAPVVGIPRVGIELRGLAEPVGRLPVLPGLERREPLGQRDLGLGEPVSGRSLGVHPGSQGTTTEENDRERYCSTHARPTSLEFGTFLMIE